MFMGVALSQLVETQPVMLVYMGSNPIGHPHKH